jgi:hypothetical protein
MAQHHRFRYAATWNKITSEDQAPSCPTREKKDLERGENISGLKRGEEHKEHTT